MVDVAVDVVDVDVEDVDVDVRFVDDYYVCYQITANRKRCLWN